MKLLMYKEVGSEQADRRTLLGIYTGQGNNPESSIQNLEAYFIYTSYQAARQAEGGVVRITIIFCDGSK